MFWSHRIEVYAFKIKQNSAMHDDTLAYASFHCSKNPKDAANAARQFADALDKAIEEFGIENIIIDTNA